MICTQRTALLASSALRTAHQANVGRKWAAWGKRAPQAFRFDEAASMLIVAINGDGQPVTAGKFFYHPDFDTIGWPG